MPAGNGWYFVNNYFTRLHIDGNFHWQACFCWVHYHSGAHTVAHGQQEGERTAAGEWGIPGAQGIKLNIVRASILWIEKSSNTFSPNIAARYCLLHRPRRVILLHAW